MVKEIEGHISEAPVSNPPRILLHVMSNGWWFSYYPTSPPLTFVAGGVCSLVDLAAAIHKRGLRAPEGTKCAIVFDSAPAPVTFSMMNRAFTAGILSRIMKYLMMAFVSSTYVVMTLVGILFRTPRPIQREMAALNDPRLLPWTSTRTPRMYLYSSGDQIVPESGVEEHAAKARMAGYPVQMVHFGSSAHVTHARNDPEKYWRSIKTFWEEVNS